MDFEKRFVWFDGILQTIKNLFAIHKKLYYDDNRVETIEIGGSYVKKQHYAETLIDEIKKNKYRK